MFAERRTAGTNGSTWAAATAHRMRRTCSATDVLRANPRTSTYPQPEPAGRLSGRTEFRAARRRQHPRRAHATSTSSPGAGRFPLAHRELVQHHVVLRRAWDYQSGDDLNVIGDPATGGAAGPSVPGDRHDRKHLQSEHTWTEQRSLAVPLHTELRRRLGDQRQLLFILSDTFRTRWNPTSDTRQCLRDHPPGLHGKPHHAAQPRPRPRFIRLPFDTTFSVFYIYTGPNRTQRHHRRGRIGRGGAERHAVERTGRLDPSSTSRILSRSSLTPTYAHRRRLAPRQHPAGERSGVGSRSSRSSGDISTS